MPKHAKRLKTFPSTDLVVAGNRVSVCVLLVQLLTSIAGCHSVGRETARNVAPMWTNRLEHVRSRQFLHDTRASILLAQMLLQKI